MISSNLGWLFYKDYFSEIIYDDLKLPDENSENFKQRMEDKYQHELNQLGNKPYDKEEKKRWEKQRYCIINKNECSIYNKITKLINQTPIITKAQPLGNIQFKATTTYPGLLVGSGTTHELPSLEGQAILGFSFDYTTGLPIISGSSIKGVLRSAFQYTEYIQELLEEENITLEKQKIQELEKEIFGQENGSNVVNSGKDIFFDAQIESAGAGGKILCDDFITPHKNRNKNKPDLPDEVVNPIPLRFIKVLPNVVFRFDLALQNSLITKEQKATLFTKILVDLGIGAKTNVGYGKLNIKTSFMPDEDPLEKLLILHECNAPRLLQAYDQGITGIETFKDRFKSELIKILEKDLEKAKSKFKPKILKRLQLVKSDEF